MDNTERNLEAILAIRLHNMAVEELVQADRRTGCRFHFSDGVWWREVKPFFYLPANFMTCIAPQQARPKAWLALGGYYHMVPPGVAGNGQIVTNEVPEPAVYRLESLKANKRREIRRALAFFRISRVENLADLLGDGFRVYLDWEQKTKNVRGKLSNPAAFSRWITSIFHHPYKLILGAYAQEQLVAFLIADAVEGVANVSNTFSHSSFNSLTPRSALNYAYVKICGQQREIRKACDGLRSLKDSLEHYKSELGFQHVSYPAFISLRRVLHPVVRWLMPSEYRRLMGQYQTDSPSAALPPVK
jgi:hypothetical protein